jgi:hypothetical protein
MFPESQWSDPTKWHKPLNTPPGLCHRVHASPKGSCQYDNLHRCGCAVAVIDPNASGLSPHTVEEIR